MTFASLLTFLGTATVFQNCGEVDPVSMGMSSYLEQMPKCTPNTMVKASAFSAQDKVKIDAAWLTQHGRPPSNNPGQATVQGKTTTEDVIVPRGSQFTMITDQQCAKEHQVTQKSNQARALTLAVDTQEIDVHVGGNGQKAHVIEIPRDLSVRDLKKMAVDDPCVVGMNPTVWREKSYVPSDSGYYVQAHLPAINAPAGWDIFYSSSSGITREVVIAIIDDGTDFGHTDLASVNAGSEHNFVSGVGSAAPENPPGANQPTGHGTHVACLAGGQVNPTGVVGVLGQRQKIMGLNVFGNLGGASDAAVRNALHWAADHGAHVINMSLGTKPGAFGSPAEEEGIDYALSRGLVIAIAAGNDNNNNDSASVYPTNFAVGRPGVISVASTVAQRRVKSNFSNFGPSSVKIGAPGSMDPFTYGSGGTAGPGLLSCYIRKTTGEDQWAFMQGTSMASPVVAGALAAAYGLWWSKAGTKPTPAQIEAVLLDSADKLGELTPYVQSGNYLNLQRLAELVNQRATGPNPISSPSPAPIPSPSPTQRPSPSPQPSTNPGIPSPTQGPTPSQMPTPSGGAALNPCPL